MSRPQVGIDRLPTAGNRRMSNEPKESMNCKSCRKRKIKCNRSRPTCEACQVFQCPCIYDAVPKKRGPKTDVLEALLKRVDGLERRLKDEKKSRSSSSPGDMDLGMSGEAVKDESQAQQQQQSDLDTTITNIGDDSAVYSPPAANEASPSINPDVLLDTFFSRVHGKPYYVLDETMIRQRLAMGQIPSHLLNAIYAISARYTAHPNGYYAAAKLSEDYASRARAEVDLDDPSIDSIQTLLLLNSAFLSAGKGKKAYMLLGNAIAMSLALELHRELNTKMRITTNEREMRRRLYWTCYVLDRFAACGSKRPSFIADSSIFLRLPSWSPNPAAMPAEGEFFQIGSNLQYYSGSGKKSQGSSGMLIDIVRILGITNRYLAAGGVKGDSHFPWHSLSNLSKIRQDLDIWASGTQDVFSSVEALFGHPESTSLVLSKLTYHLIHCLIYRPFLPIDLAELAGAGQHQSWQIEATNLCFLHANAIAELVELGKQSGSMEWPSFVGYCVCTAGTVHVHGAHYKGNGEGEVFSTSADFLSREMQQLSELRYAWASVQHQRHTLQTIYSCHSELVKSLANNPTRYSPVLHLEDFFDRYSSLGQFFDGAHVSFVNITVDPMQEAYVGHDLYAPRIANGTTHKAEKAPRRKSSSYVRKSASSLAPQLSERMENPLVIGPETLPDPLNSNNVSLQQQNLMPDPSSMTPFPGAGLADLSATPFSPPYQYANLNQPESFDPMFGMPVSSQMNGFSYDPNPVITPGGRSNNGSTGTGGEEKDPFLSLLEQLAENEYNQGGPSELDYFLTQGQQ